MYMYTNSQKDNATSTWRLNIKVLIKFLITDMWTPDYDAQNQRIENRVN